MQNHSVYVCESEKGTMQLVDMGYANAVSTGGKRVGSIQIEKLTRLCVPIIFCFDKDVQKEELSELADRFIDNIEIYALIDSDNILNEKESPTDDPKKFEILRQKYKVRLK